MKILDTPDCLRRPHYNYPRHNVDFKGIEAYVHQHLIESPASSDVDYIPIYWSNNYFHDQRERRIPGYRALAEAQSFLDDLPRDRQYVTTVQFPEGTYERLPEGTIVFGAGGTGDYAIPLLSQTHDIPSIPSSRLLLASFVGNIECGGPDDSIKPSTSSWNQNASGAVIRRAMADVFSSTPDVHIEQRTGNTDDDVQQFRRIMVNSIFALAPRGYGKTSFRLYEALQFGCIPVYIYDDPWLPYEELIDWSEFSVLCHIDNIDKLPLSLQEIPSDWITAAERRLSQYAATYFTLQGLATYIQQVTDKI